MLSIGVIIKTHHLCAECWAQKPRSRKHYSLEEMHTPQSALHFIHEHENRAALLTTALETTLTQRPVTEGGILTNKYIFQQSHEAKRERLEVNIGHPGRKVLFKTLLSDVMRGWFMSHIMVPLVPRCCENTYRPLSAGYLLTDWHRNNVKDCNII